MKHLLVVLFFIPFLLSAQEDQRYLAGAVPVENGKVIFSKDIKASSYSKDQIYDIMLNWANGFFNTPERRVVYSNKEKGEIAVVAEEFIVFSSTALALDRATISYRLIIECKDHSCYMEIGGIRYEYNVSYQKDPEKYMAEEWIIDKYALNKNGTKLNRIAGKFRRKTIDLVDNIFQSATSAMGVQMLNQNTEAVSATPITPTTNVVPATPLVPAIPVTPTATTSTKDGFVAFDADKIPNTILQMLPNNQMEITSDKEKSLSEKQAEWKGIGNMFGKTIATISVQAGSDMNKLIGNNDIYSISFSKSADETPWMIIECSKQGETTEGNQKTVIGEIVNVWIK